MFKLKSTPELEAARKKADALKSLGRVLFVTRKLPWWTWLIRLFKRKNNV